ncbi:MAG: hypothetical protein COA42_10305 [Alteromonadaceae bacterium]|nr:MAG: hypothetical protein COA42_10305 [Alteromonadaceae bacterium]
MNRKTKQTRASAAHWLTEMQSPTWDDAQQNRFELWLQQAPLHRETYLQMQHVWEDLSELADSPEALRLQNATPSEQTTNAPTTQAPSHPAQTVTTWIRKLLDGLTWFKPLAFGSAASISLCVALYLGFLNLPASKKAEWIQVSTEVAEIQSLNLEDGSQIILNGQSTLQYRLLRERREVKLLSGQAFFDVASDVNRPFIIDSGEVRIKVVGTQFDVKNIQSIVQVAVLEGHVKVSTLTADNTSNNISSNTSDKAEIPQIRSLYAGNKIEIRRGEPLGKVKTISRKQIASWKNGSLIYENTPLREVIDDINRYYPGTIEIDGNALGDIPITAAFSLKNIDKVPAMIQHLLPIEITTHEGNKLILSDKSH